MNLQPTPYDLKFRLFKVPIRVHPSFWLVSAFFAFPLATIGIQFFLIGIACVFVSVLVHELGHALMYRCYHMWSMILLYSFGGLTVPAGGLPKRSWRIIVSLCGPLANFAIAGILWRSNEIEPWVDPLNKYLVIVYFHLVIINLYLGLLNLFPVYPLNGGQISRELWMKYRNRSRLLTYCQLAVRC